jgi:hypothetical protein
MDIIEIQTLVDITNTRVIRLSQGSQLELDQQRNFITLTQCIEIRSIVSFSASPKVDEVDLKKIGFGTAYKGRHKVWTFRFETDRESVYQDNDGNPVGGLIEDLHEVPVIKNLSETINIDKSIFDCKDLLLKNTIVRIVKDTD